MTDKSEFCKVGLSYNELVRNLQERFNLSDRSARQTIAIVTNWLEDDVQPVLIKMECRQAFLQGVDK